MSNKKHKLLVFTGVQWLLLTSFFVLTFFQITDGLSFNLLMVQLLILVVCWKVYQVRFDFYARSSINELNEKMHKMGRIERRKFLRSQGVLKAIESKRKY